MNIFVPDTEFIFISFGTFVFFMKKGIVGILQAFFENKVHLQGFHNFLNVVGWKWLGYLLDGGVWENYLSFSCSVY